MTTRPSGSASTPPCAPNRASSPSAPPPARPSSSRCSTAPPPDVVLLDYYLDGEDGLTLCRRLKSTVPTPAVVLYSAYADPSMLIPAIVAGADGVVHKGVPALQLFEAIRHVARGSSALPPISAALRKAAALALNPQDLPILSMLIDQTTPADIMDTLTIDRHELNQRIHRMLTALRPPATHGALRLDA